MKVSDKIVSTPAGHQMETEIPAGPLNLFWILFQYFCMLNVC